MGAPAPLRKASHLPLASIFPYTRCVEFLSVFFFCSCSYASVSAKYIFSGSKRCSTRPCYVYFDACTATVRFVDLRRRTQALVTAALPPLFAPGHDFSAPHAFPGVPQLHRRRRLRLRRRQASLPPSLRSCSSGRHCSSTRSWTVRALVRSCTRARTTC